MLNAKSKRTMDVKFKKGQKVRFSKSNGEVFEGVISGWDYNSCTFERCYDVNYLKNGQVWTTVGIPEDRIETI